MSADFDSVEKIRKALDEIPPAMMLGTIAQGMYYDQVIHRHKSLSRALCGVIGEHSVKTTRTGNDGTTAVISFELAGKVHNLEVDSKDPDWFGKILKFVQDLGALSGTD
jgi:hypothetical protein